MILATETRSVTASGQQDARQFSVESGPHMMMILSGLYSNIPRAIVREVGTNMYDAYAPLLDERGGTFTDDLIPPEIHVPTEMEPWIEFTDFGVGMPKEQVMDRYTVYGDSTKRKDNLTVGGLGLGCKTPFCYSGADQWVVISRYNGEKHTFTALLDEGSTPTMFHIASVPTDEPNGVSVRIPIAQRDFPVFRREITAFARYFPLPLTITGDPAVKAEPVQYRVRRDTWGLNHKNTREWHVIMGNVAYPLDTSELYRNTSLSYTHTSDFSVDFYLPIGSVDFVPSREALKYTPRTYAALAEAVKTFLAEIREYAEERIEEAETAWDALVKLQALHDDGLRSIVQKATWRGEELDVFDGLRFKTETLRETIPNLEVTRYYNPYKSSKITHHLTPPRLAVSPKRKVWVYLDDLETKGTLGRVRQALTEALRRQGRTRRDEADVEAFVFRVSENGSNVLQPDMLTQLLRGTPVTLVSTLESPTEVEKRRGVRTKTMVKSWSGGTIPWEDAYNLDPDEEGGFFVRLNRDELDEPLPDGRTDSHAAAGLFYVAKQIGLIASNETLYGIPRSCRNVANKPGWTDLFEYLRLHIPPLLREQRQEIAEFEAWKQHLGTPLAKALALIDVDALGVRHPARRASEALRTACSVQRRVENLHSLASTMDIPLPKARASVAPEPLLDRIEKQYPLLPALAETAHHSYKYRISEFLPALNEYLR